MGPHHALSMLSGRLKALIFSPLGIENSYGQILDTASICWDYPHFEVLNPYIKRTGQAFYLQKSSYFILSAGTYMFTDQIFQTNVRVRNFQLVHGLHPASFI